MNHSAAVIASPPLETATGSLGILVLAVAGFVIVTTEFLIVGLLPALARDMHVSISVAGQLVTLFAFTVMLVGPFLTAAVSHLERKRLFIAILLIFAAANALAAVAPNIWILAVARFIPALVLPVFWGTASETAGELAGPQRAGGAVATVYLGISAAMLFGIPIGTLASTAFGWRGAFWMLCGMSVLMALAMLLFMPALAVPKKARMADQARILRDPKFVANVALSVVVFTAMFTAYTYLADLLERTAGVERSQVGWWLMGFGAVGLFGNWLGGRSVERRPLTATVVFTLLMAAGMALSVPASSSPVYLGVALAIWGIGHTALFPICQVRVMQAAAHSKALAGTLNVSAANAGIGLGSILGGVVIGSRSLDMLPYVAAGIGVLAAIAVPCIARLPSRDTPPVG